MLQRKIEPRGEAAVTAMAERAAVICNLFAGLAFGEELPGTDGETPISLADEAVKAEVLAYMRSLIRQVYFQREIDEVRERSGALPPVDLGLRDFAAEPSLYAAMSVCHSLATVDRIAGYFYQHGTDSPELYAVVKQLSAVCPAGLRRIIGATLPFEIRTAWPHFAGLFQVEAERTA